MNRKIDTVVTGQKTEDGAGVKLTRILSRPHVKQFDPFLMLDSFKSEDPDSPGFPWHPHRGIITITYLINGKIEHEDSLGNHGVISSGGVQWMCAASGIIHQEMPRVGPDGNRGFQFWLNLPASQKMNKPDYGDINSDEIPVVTPLEGVSINVIAGTVEEVSGPVQFDITEPEMFHIHLDRESSFEIKTAPNKNYFAVLIEGDISTDGNRLHMEQAAHFSEGESILFKSGEIAGSVLLVGGVPLKEPVAWEGPIVMNTRDELTTAFEEYRLGTFIKDS